jgi:hypothetical protein
LMVQPAHCPPGNCGGLPSCFNSALIAGSRCANASVRSQDASVQGLIGTTQCSPGGISCTGRVGLVPGGSVASSLPAAPGDGTFCTFVGFTQVSPPGLTCSTF